MNNGALDENEITHKKEIGEILNSFFIRKTEDPKQYIKDPTEKLQEKVKAKSLKFILKPVTESKVKNVIHIMKK